MKNIDMKRTAAAVCLLILAVLSVTVGKSWAKNPETHAETLAYLDEKQSDVMALSATSLSASTALTLIPGDAATPIANELAELSIYFIITICAILLEKGLITVTGYLSFGFLIPAGLVALAAFAIFRHKTRRNISVKLIALALTVYMLVPVSVGISKTIESSYTKSTRQTIQEVNRTIEDIETSTEAEKFSIANILSGIKNGASETVANIEGMLNDFIEQIAIMLVTSCLIPVFVLLLFGRIIKMLADGFIAMTVNMNTDRFALSHKPASYIEKQ